MNLFRKITPNFLKNIDSYLRVNYPWLWATRIHFNVAIAIALSFFFFLIGFLINIDQKDILSRMNLEVTFSILMLLSVAWLIVTLRQMSLYNIDKIYGKHKFYREFLVFIIYMFSFSLPLLLPFTITYTLNYRVANICTDDEFKADTETYNKGLMYFPVKAYDYNYYQNDSSYKVAENPTIALISTATHQYSGQMEEAGVVVNNLPRNDEMRDSVYYERGVFEKSRPSLYYTMNYEDFNNNYFDKRSDSVPSPIALFIYNRNLDRDKTIAKEQIMKFICLLNKYTSNTNIDASLILSDYVNCKYSTSYSNNNLIDATSELQDNMESIGAAKNHKGYYFEGITFMVLLVVVFYIAILFNIFKHVKGAQFLLAMAVAVVSGIVLAIISAITSHFDYIFFYGLFLLIAIAIGIFIKSLVENKYHVTYNQACIFLNWILPILPIIILNYMAIALDFFQSKMFDIYKIPVVEEYTKSISYQYSPEYYAMKDLCYMLTLWGGIALYLFVWNSLLKKQYLKLWSLPRNS